MNYKGDMYVLCIQGVSKKAANRMLLYWDQGAPTHQQASTPLATGNLNHTWTKNCFLYTPKPVWSLRAMQKSIGSLVVCL